MWNEYSLSYIKKNKASSISILAAAFISAMFLSLITSIFYNMWIDNIQQVVTKEGDWQVKITTDFENSVVQNISNTPGIKEIKEVVRDGNSEIWIYMNKMRQVYEIMPTIIKQYQIENELVQYHETLLSQYFIFDPADKQPPLLLAFFVFVMIVACISLILIIKNAFMVSIQARLHQLGILQSIGATPKQIKSFLVQEALTMCLIPILVGIFVGILLCILLINYANHIAGDFRNDTAIFTYHIILFILSFITSAITVLISAWIPARKLSKLAVIQAIKGEEEENVRKVKKFRIMSHLFGIEGELARKSLYIRRKSLRTATLSLTLSFFAFSMVLCFVSLSALSTKYTYFERYKDSWDIMVEVNTPTDETKKRLDIEGLRKISGVETVIKYKKATTYTNLSENQFSQGVVDNLGGKSLIPSSSGMYRIKVPVIILDEKSFQNYCESIGVNYPSDGIGVVTINQIWDSLHSNFRNKKYVPFLQEDLSNLQLYSKGDPKTVVEINVLDYTQSMPVLRESIDNNTLMQIMSQDTWELYFPGFTFDDSKSYLNIQTISDEVITQVESEIEQELTNYDYEIENRVEEEEVNGEMQTGYMCIMGGLCGLLAIIGLANVLSNTLGYISQRKKEFARYQSIGITQGGIKKMLYLEAFVIGGKPILITIPLTILFIIFAAKASYINVSEAFGVIPVGIILLFAIVVLGGVIVAYEMGFRKISKENMIEALKDDTMR